MDLKPGSSFGIVGAVGRGESTQVMHIPQHLTNALSTAATSITAEGELPAATRKDLLQLIEALSVTEHADAGYLRRARLAVICAREVLGRLSPYPSVLTAAEAILASGIDALSGKCDFPTLEIANGEYHTKVIDLFQHGEPAFVSVYAGMAVFSAMNTILYDTNFDVVGESEQSVPPDDWDAGYYGALAVSGSAIWEAKGGAERRRSYWLWYLQNAAPVAWDVLVPLRRD
ncbi:Imm5 family immunity protein [Burkholderia sp. BCCIQ04A]|uniref:Imm5 family immunity protein n=2 Tax=Burkholderiaceae TaxID=119060 RepID=A0ABU5WVD9_9BURK|nr:MULTISPECIES: Imm5 family immunity protein [Burkholderia]MEB2505313.1 Imm5 family immunity protein [Burkholderia anthinoferrum]MEB2529984.1 Imm5 family immunity protein [Burkholderia anthinoferrum]MEB2563582.1 Imm5 family immunity protein [Burkholderia anthinoferrum]MEB2582222.1 Imm5 family immunity protein [Burkholderia anthinoferrum]MCA8107973.1 immunity protein Imm5 [Burkholderia sp. AU36459]